MPTQSFVSGQPGADPTQSVGAGSTEASIDQVNQWMRQTPWYQTQMRIWGQDPGHPTLTKNQSQQLLKMAQSQGVQVDEGKDEIDDHGNFNPKGNKLRNTLIVAGIAAAAIAAPYAWGAWGGGAGATPVALGAGGVESGVTAGLGATALPNAGIALGTAGGAAGAAAVPLTAEAANLAAGGIAGSGIEEGGALSKIAGLIGKGSTLSKVAGSVSDSIAGMSKAAGQNQLEKQKIEAAANQQNIAGQSAFETELMNRARLDAEQRKTALHDVARESYFSNRAPGPNNTAGVRPLSDSYITALANSSRLGQSRVAQPAMAMPNLAPYTPYSPAATIAPTTTQNIANYAAPALSTYEQILKAMGK